MTQRNISPPAQSEEALRVADYAAVTQAGYPAYLGGPFAFRSEQLDNDARLDGMRVTDR